MVLQYLQVQYYLDAQQTVAAKEHSSVYNTRGMLRRETVRDSSKVITACAIKFTKAPDLLKIEDIFYPSSGRSNLKEARVAKKQLSHG